jgi:septal ring factor EnvC (AmiA/AmiB activator)
MVRIKSSFLIFFIFFFIRITPGFSQTKTGSLKVKRQILEKEITYTNRLIAEVNKSKKNTVYELQLINNRIGMRRRLIVILKKEIATLSNTIAVTGIKIRDLNARLDTLKKEYARIAWYLYKNDNNYNRLIFLFSAKDFNQAYQRLRYLDEISAYIRKEAGRIKNLEKQKNDKLTKMIWDKAEKKALLDKETTQLSQLQLEQHKKSRLKQKLAGQERSLRARLRRKQKESKRLQAQIEKAIAIAAKKAAGKTKSRRLSASEMRLSSTFMANKGRLPWPVENGVVSLTFGIHNHPVLKHVKIKNNGINIATSKGSLARAVFPGSVVNIVRITNTNIAVILKHGNYYTVYSELDKVLVKNNQQVLQHQALGVIHTNLQGKTELHFEVWHEKYLQNPAYWLRRNVR